MLRTVLLLAALLISMALPAAAAEDVQQPDLFGGPHAEPAAALPATPAARDRAAELVVTAMNFLGVRYRRGGTNENGFDCSGFTRHIVETSLGLVLPRRADEQAGASGLVAVRRDQLKPGDLVFFNTLKRTFSHVGIYLGEGRFIHAPRPGGAVRIEDMGYSYWRKRYTGARRLDTLGAASPAVHAEAPTQAE